MRIYGQVLFSPVSVMAARQSDILALHVERILDALPDGVFISDAAGVTLRVNRMYEQLTGLRQEHVQGRNVRELLEEGIFDHILNPEIVRTGKSVTHVQNLKNGKRLALTGFPVYDSGGTLCLVVTLARDITLLTSLQDQVTEQCKLLDQINDRLVYITQENNKGDEPTLFASPVMADVVSLLRRVAGTDATVLILGETGVGKDVFARLTHSLSARGEKLFLKVDCGGISEALTESEMFGYMPGAFTGASSKGKAGYFEMADGGTIFLDEVGELPLTMQTRLLRVLQDGEIMRVGGASPRKVDVRVIAATNRDLAQSVAEGAFRRDLYHRLNVVTVTIPPLRERPEDVRVLAERFLRQYTAKYHKSIAFMGVTLDMMAAYSWPGNVRELQNLVHSLVITHTGPLIAPRDLPAHLSGTSLSAARYPEEILTARRPLKEIMAELERDFLLKAIEVHGSVQRVAALFQINRSTVFRKLQGADRRSGQDA